MKKKVILLASFAILAGSGVLYALNNSNHNAKAEGSCCREKAKSCCASQACETECTCSDECTGESCDCGCACCK